MKMEKMNALTLIITLVVGVILAGALLGPVISDATKTTETFTNEGYFYMQKISAEDTTVHTLTYETDGTDAGIVFALDGVEIDTSTWPANNQSVTLATDGASWVMRAAVNEYVGLQGIGSTLNFGGHDVRTATVTFDSGVVTVARTVYNPDTGQTDAGRTITGSYTDLWIYSATPTEHVMKKADATAYLLDDSEYLAMGVTKVSEWNTVIKVTGGASDFDATIVYPPNVTTTVTNEHIDSSEVNGYNSLNALDKLTFTISDGTNTVNATYSYFIVPAEVTSELTNHLTPGQISLMGAIPVMVIVALLMVAVRLISTKD